MRPVCCLNRTKIYANLADLIYQRFLNKIFLLIRPCSSLRLRQLLRLTSIHDKEKMSAATATRVRNAAIG